MGSNWQLPSTGLDDGLQQIGNKPLPEPMLTQFIDAYMRH